MEYLDPGRRHFHARAYCCCFKAADTAFTICFRFSFLTSRMANDDRHVPNPLCRFKLVFFYSMHSEGFQGLICCVFLFNNLSALY